LAYDCQHPATRTFAGWAGLAAVALDTLNPHHPEGVGARYLLNLVAVKWLHNRVHLAIGASGLWAARAGRVRAWATWTGVLLLALFAAGIVQAVSLGLPKDQVLLGLVPLNSPGHMLHLITGGLALFLARAPGRGGSG
jgi:hypothetical protein